MTIFGEAIVDFLPGQRGRIRHVETFRKSVGGAPANVAVSLARLGIQPQFLGRLGDDEFGWFLHDALEAENVDVSRIRFTDEAKTGLAFVSIDHDGERSFLGFRGVTAEKTLKPDDFNDTVLGEVVVLGSNLMTYEGGHGATLDVLHRAHRAESLVVFDANIRLHLWANPAHAVPTIRDALRFVDVLKVSDEELELLCEGEADPVRLYDQLHPVGVRWLVATLGENGARVIGPDVDLSVPAAPCDVVDTTGAGDAFVAGLVYGLVTQTVDHTEAPRYRPAHLGDDRWRQILALANYTGSRACSALGAVTATPDHRDVPWEKLGWSPDGRLL